MHTAPGQHVRGLNIWAQTMGFMMLLDGLTC